MNFDIYLGPICSNVHAMFNLKDLEVLPTNKKLGLDSNGNCTILPVDLCCMKFRHRLNIMKKANMYA